VVSLGVRLRLGRFVIDSKANERLVRASRRHWALPGNLGFVLYFLFDQICVRQNNYGFLPGARGRGHGGRLILAVGDLRAALAHESSNVTVHNGPSASISLR
jgi:hypothetical protein